MHCFFGLDGISSPHDVRRMVSRECDRKGRSSLSKMLSLRGFGWLGGCGQRKRCVFCADKDWRDNGC